ncbi:hypothetical protein QO058_07910 [Bosea vestrisii]|uniref:hypothetical protein n=1 Tax=Bosea vestrisii TaxID=151416 RepID=UPI0024DF3101|nr:hypothetical protein [Bosea vestrisii]WID98156.1 hypothetical protein QO058_07910 [Bosea vestrisii]
MFNVIMRHYDWNDQTASMDLRRMFEHTDEGVAAQFQDGNFPALDRLMRLPCLFIPEGIGDEICRVGTVTSARITNGEVRFEYTLDPDVPPMQNSTLHAQKGRLDMDRDRHNFDWHRNHWAVKDIDLYRILFRSVNPRRQRPSVFNIPEHERIEAQLMSVMMPFDAGFASVYAAIQEAGVACNLLTRRADEIWEAPGIIQDVVSLIDRARIVVCDLTGRNPNVFYEAGIAHTLGREVIIITQSEHDVPFDLRHLRHIRYLNNNEGRVALRQALQARIATILGH